MKCEKCGHEQKDKGRAKGGRKSKRRISPEAQAKMQSGRRKGDDRKKKKGET